jgi:hypothetical protein
VAAVAGIALAGLLLHSQVTATASRAAPNAPRPAQVAAANDGKAPGTYQLRCWQYGRLLFDEGPVTLPPETRQAGRVVAFDRNGAAVIVTDSGTTTCMARPSAPAPSPALQR